MSMPPSPNVVPADAPARVTVFEAVLATELERIRPLRRSIEALLCSEGFSEEDAADVGLVATELLQNAIEHGSRGDGREAVRLRCELPSPGTVLLDVTDPGTGRGLASLLGRDVTIPPPIDAVRGRGLFLVHRMSTSLDRGGTDGGRSLVRVRFEAGRAPGTSAS